MAKKKGKIRDRMNVIGKKIRALRLSRNMSIEDLSRNTSVSSVTISNIEKGIYSPKLGTIIEIARALDTTVTYLIEDVDAPRIYKINKDKQKLTTADGVSLLDFGPVMMNEKVSVYLMEMERGVSTSEHDSFDGNEFVHVLQGRISVTIEDRTEIIEEGESLYFHASYRHILKAEKKSKIIFISTFA